MVPISACIITYNEENNIRRCIEALAQIADEVLVVDSFSKDSTVTIAQSLGARVLQRTFTGYGDQKLYAQDQAQHDWVLSIDADEVISPELKQALLQVKEHPTKDAYYINILANYCGQWIRHCGWYPQPKLRLYNRRKGSMLIDKVHEGISLEDDARVAYLKGDLLHYSYNTISDHLKKLEVYSEIGARSSVERGRNVSLLKLIIAPRLQFVADYFLKLGFLDGYYGYILCRNSAFGSFVKYAKIRQYMKLKQRGLPY
jgi:glycosyltransferase involved in cell wall biosynthesis